MPIKKIFRFIAGTLVLGLGMSAFTAFAAPINYSADTTVTLTSPSTISLTIKANSTADSVVVNTGNIVATVSGTEQFVVTSASNGLSSSVAVGSTGNASVTLSCSSGTQTATVNANSGSGTFTLTPTGSQCSSGAGSSGGGGGGGSTTTTPPPATTAPSTTTGTVSATAAAGGSTTLTNSDNSSAAVSLPANALTADSTVAVSANTTPPTGASATPGANLSKVGSYYNFTATQNSNGANVTTFNSNVTLTFNYLQSQIPTGVAESSLQIYYYDTIANRWTLAGGTVNTTTNIITLAINHFTVFAIFGSAATTTPPTTPTPPAAPTPPYTPPPPSVPGTATVAGAHADGTLVISGKTIFLMRNGARAGFRDAAEYKSYGYNFKQVVKANSVDLSLPVTAVLKAFSGTLVLDKSDNKTIYMVGGGGTKYGFTSMAVLKGLGYKTSLAVKINLSDYTAGSPISSATSVHPNGSLVKSGGAIWWISGGSLMGFPSQAVFNSYGFSSSRVVSANAADQALPKGAVLTFRDGTLIKDKTSGAYYIMSNGKKRAFSSQNALKSAGYSANNVIKADLSAILAGDPTF